MLRLAKIALLGTTVALLSACGENPLAGAFKNVSLSNIDSNGNAFVELKTEVGSENVIFSMATLPIVDPKTGKELGVISMERTLDGRNLLTVRANVTGIKLGNVLPDNKLPNGNNVPVAGLSSLIAVPAGQNSRVYVGQAGDKLMVGVAVAVEQFDNLAAYIPGASVFFNLATSAGLPGVAGFFTSKESGKSGLALFTQTTMPSGLPSGVLAQSKAGPSSDLKFVSRKPTTTQSNYFGYFVNKWGRSKTKLKMK